MNYKDSKEELDDKHFELELPKRLGLNRNKIDENRFLISTTVSSYTINFNMAPSERLTYPEQIRYHRKDAERILKKYKAISTCKNDYVSTFKDLDIISEIRNSIFLSIKNFGDNCKKKNYLRKELVLYKIKPVQLEKDILSRDSIIFQLKILLKGLILDKYWFEYYIDYQDSTPYFHKMRLRQLRSIRVFEFEKLVRICILNFEAAKMIGLEIKCRKDDDYIGNSNDYVPKKVQFINP